MRGRIDDGATVPKLHRASVLPSYQEHRARLHSERSVEK